MFGEMKIHEDPIDFGGSPVPFQQVLKLEALPHETVEIEGNIPIHNPKIYIKRW